MPSETIDQNPEDALRKAPSLEGIKNEISANLEVLEEALRERKLEVVEALGAEVIKYVSKRAELKEAVDVLGEYPQGTTPGALLTRSIFDANKNILEWHIGIVDEYLKTYSEAEKSEHFRGSFTWESTRGDEEPQFLGIALTTYEHWLERDLKTLSNIQYKPGMIDALRTKVTDYENHMEVIGGVIQELMKINENTEIEFIRALHRNDIARLQLVQMAIQKYLDAYQDIIAKHQEQELTI
jgi:hypothetical protein